MSDDFVKVFGDKVPVHQTLSVAEQQKQDAVEFEARKSADPKLVPDVYDMWHDAQTQQHQAAPTGIPDAAERENIIREERAFLKAFERGLADFLRGYQMTVMRAMPDGEGNGWRIHVRDNAGRPFDVHISYEETIAAGEKHGAAMGSDLMKTVARKLIGARSHYLSRMQ